MFSIMYQLTCVGQQEAYIKLVKITGKLTPEHVKLKRNILWNIIELGWKEVIMTT